MSPKLPIAFMAAICSALRLWSPSPTFAADGLPPEELFSRLARSIVVVIALDAKLKSTATGSGVVVSARTIATNCHVVAGATSVKIQQQGMRFSAFVAHREIERDVCILTMISPPASIVRAGETIVYGSGAKVGQSVYAIGAPLGLELTMSRGIISSIRPGPNGAAILQTDAAISPGSSGGGLFDQNGALLGLTTFQAKEGQNLNFAVPASWIIDAIAAAEGKVPARSSTLAQDSASRLETPAPASSTTEEDLERHSRAETPSREIPQPGSPNNWNVARQWASRLFTKAVERAALEPSQQVPNAPRPRFRVLGATASRIGEVTLCAASRDATFDTRMLRVLESALLEVDRPANLRISLLIEIGKYGEITSGGTSLQTVVMDPELLAPKERTIEERTEVLQFTQALANEVSRRVRYPRALELRNVRGKVLAKVSFNDDGRMIGIPD